MANQSSVPILEGYYHRGFMVSTAPPLYFGFSFNPETYDDSIEPNYTHHGSPGSRFKYPMYTGMSERIITFTLDLDENFPAACEEGANIIKNYYGGKHPEEAYSFLGDVSMYRVEMAIASLEAMKLPKTPLVTNTVQNASGGFFSIASQTHSAPPLVFLSLSLDKYYLGYVKAKINPEKFNRHMQIVEATVDIEFIVSPDYVTTSMGDALRFLKSTANLATLGVGNL